VGEDPLRIPALTVTCPRGMGGVQHPDIDPAVVPFVEAAFESGDWYVLGHLFP
jgi:hypothetical protein